MCTSTSITTLTHADLPSWAVIRGDGRLGLWMPTDSPCCDCGANVHRIGEYYAVTNRTWHAAGMCRWGLLCIGCIENRLGRQLVPADFTDVPINRLDRPMRRSPRFIDRLTGRGTAPAETVPAPRRPETCTEVREH